MTQREIDREAKEYGEAAAATLPLVFVAFFILAVVILATPTPAAERGYTFRNVDRMADAFVPLLKARWGCPADWDYRTRRLIDAALKSGVQRVVVPLIRGNHAEQAEFALAFALWCWYRDDKRVEVDHTPAYRKTFEWGDCLLAFTHGKEASRKKLPTLIMSEFREQVGRKYIEIHTGDLHQVRLEEEFGIRVRILPSLAGTDAWHARKGYVGNLPQSETYFWHKRDGLRAIFPFTA